MCLFSHKFGTVGADGWQYCTKCGKAVKPHPCKNGHIWEEVTSATVKVRNTGSLKGRSYVQRCKNCGKLDTYYANMTSKHEYD